MLFHQIVHLTAFVAPLVCLQLIREVQKKMAENEIVQPEDITYIDYEPSIVTPSSISVKNDDRTKSIEFDFSPISSNSSFLF